MSESISQLPAATSVASGDIMPLTQGSTGPGTGTTRYGTVAQILASGGSVVIGTTFRVNGSTGPTWTAGTGAPTSSQPYASLYTRTDGTPGATLYISHGSGTWAAVTGVNYGSSYSLVQSGYQLCLPGSQAVLDNNGLDATANGGTATISLTGLPSHTTYSITDMIELGIYARNPGTGARTGALVYLGLARESGNASVTVKVTNLFGTEFGAGTGTVQVTAVCAVDGSSITVTVTNTDASNDRQLNYIAHRYLA